jgi:hypothetical protein
MDGTVIKTPAANATGVFYLVDFPFNASQLVMIVRHNKALPTTIPIA